MARRSKPHKGPDALADELVRLISGFRAELKSGDLRAKVRSLIPAFHKLRDLGSSLISADEATGGRDRILAYFQKYPRVVLDGDELMVVSGIGEWARRVRELRVQLGWWIYSGVTFRQIIEEAKEQGEKIPSEDFDFTAVKPDQYVLMREEQDRDAAYRWNVLNEVRRQQTSVKDKLITYFRRNVGKPVSGEELRYLAKDKNEWPRRVRELRTEEGWPIVTNFSGREDLGMGVYLLEEDRQAEPHDRKISDSVRVKVLTRDSFSCTSCDWNRDKLVSGDPRKFLELHHKTFHGDKGKNTEENLVTLCNVCHDELHTKAKRRTK